jgi:hypothetical protein
VVLAHGTISIDLELAWGVWDHLTPEDLRHAESAGRPVPPVAIMWLPRGGSDGFAPDGLALSGRESFTAGTQIAPPANSS